MIGKRKIAEIAALRVAGRVWVVLLLMVVLVAIPGLGLAQGENAPDNSSWVWMADLIPWETMFGWVKYDSVAKGLAFAILVVFVAVLVWLWVVWWNNASALRRFRRKILGISRDPYGFAEHFRDLGLDMPGKRFAGLKHAWEEFRESVFTAKDDEGKILAYNTVPPENFFTPEKLGMNFASFRALANYFVGVGLLLTFFGLAAALFFANKGITEGGNVEETQKSLQVLLNAATLKFMTSIAGLFSSIALSVFVLIASRHVSRLCASICEELEARVRFAVQEHFAMLQWQELRKQTVALETFSTDLAVSIAGRIAIPVSAGVFDALTKSGLPGLTEEMGKVSGQVETLVSDVSRVSKKLDNLARDIAGGIAEPVKSGVEGAMEPLREEITKLANNVVKGGKEGVEEITKDIPEKMQKAANTISTASGRLADATNELKSVAEGLQVQVKAAGAGFGDEMSEASKEVSKTVEGVGDKMRRLDAVVGGLGKILDEHRQKFQGLVDATQSASNALSAAAVRHTEAARPIATAAERIGTAANTIRDLGQVVQETHKSLENIHQQVKDSNAELRRFWEQHDGRFAGVDEKMGAVVEKMVEGNNAYRGSVTNFVTELAGKLEGALGQLSAAIEELGGIVEEMQDGASARGKK